MLILEITHPTSFLIAFLASSMSLITAILPNNDTIFFAPNFSAGHSTIGGDHTGLCHKTLKKAASRQPF
jgi:hypothetical protein